MTPKPTDQNIWFLSERIRFNYMNTVDINECGIKLHILIDNIKSEMRSFKSNENIHKKEGGSYYVVSANKASSVTL